MANRYEHLDDESLFVLVRDETDSRAFDALYARYERRLFAYCLSIVRDQQSAQDAFQTVVSTMFEKRKHFKGGSFAAWVFTIARHACIKLSRKNARSAPLDEAEHLQEMTTEMTEDVLMSEALQQAIASLSDEYKQAIELRYYGGLPYDEIAKVMDIGLSSAKMKVSRARKMLQKFLLPYVKELK